MDLADRLLAGDRRALSRAISVVENGAPEGREIMREIFPHTGRAYVIGVTGAPGSGKSTLVAGLIRRYREKGLTIGVVAVDPTSPFSGGALLGDRIRMTQAEPDQGVFIRSLASRGQVGGLSRATGDVIALLDAGGKDLVLVETVGAGQTEIDVMRLAYTTVVILAPGLGDEIQAIKAGILEIGDLFVVNKVDLEGADRTVLQLEAMLDMVPTGRAWKPPVLKTVAVTGEGLDTLIENLDSHREFMEKSGDKDRRRRRYYAARIEEIIKDRVMAALAGQLAADVRSQGLVDRILRGEIDPYTAADELWSGLKKNEEGNGH